MISDALLEHVDLPLEDYYICYFDILGYKDFLENNPESHKKFLLDVILSDGNISSIIRNASSPVSIQYRTYSDNFLIAFEKKSVDETKALYLLSKIVRKIQVVLLSEHKIIVRGGITVGEFFCDDKIVFGPGLIRAVELESKYAKMPRIVIDKECLKEAVIELEKKEIILKDTDEYYYVNYFDNENALKLIRGSCVNLINKNCKYHPTVKDESKILLKEKTIGKYIWILMKFNEGCDVNSIEDMKIVYNLSINTRLFKTEVTCK